MRARDTFEMPPLRFFAVEPFVDADHAAEFLSVTRRRLLDMARTGSLPGHLLGEGVRRVWRFRLSELQIAVSNKVNSNRQFPARDQE
jgi:hypothetical protein